MCCLIQDQYISFGRFLNLAFQVRIPNHAERPGLLVRTRWGGGGRHHERFDNGAIHGSIRKIPNRTTSIQEYIISQAAFQQGRIGRRKR